MNNYQNNNRGGYTPRTGMNLDVAPNKTEFMAHTLLFEKMRPTLEKAATRIKQAIKDEQRIFVKHHNDCDGYCSGFVLEQAIVPLIEKVSTKRNAVHENFRRLASFSPYYHVEDMMKDCAQFLSIIKKFGGKPPLVILTDLGSGPENIMPIKQLKTLGCEVIVIDHHPVNDEVDAVVDIHVNPHLFDAPNELSAGIICAEVARMINTQTQGYDIMAATSAISDRVEAEYAAPYLEIAQQKGFPREKLLEIVQSLEFIVYHIRNLEANALLDILFGTDIEKRDSLLSLHSAEIARRSAIVILQAEQILRVEKIGVTNVLYLPVDQMLIKDNYPRMGIIIDIVKEHMMKSGKLADPFVVLGTTDSLLLTRASDDSAYNFPEMLIEMKDKVPLSFAEGGGHPHAGTFKFVPAQFEAVHKQMKSYIERLQ